MKFTTKMSKNYAIFGIVCTKLYLKNKTKQNKTKTKQKTKTKHHSCNFLMYFDWQRSINIFNPSSPKGGCNNPHTVSPRCSDARPRGKIALGTFRFILPLILARKKNESTTSPWGAIFNRNPARYCSTSFGRQFIKSIVVIWHDKRMLLFYIRN